MNKIKIAKVVIKWSEAWTGDTKPKEFATVKEAEKELMEISADKKAWDDKHGYKECMGYNKTGIDIYFEDGEVYADARFDVQWGKDYNDTDIRRHVKNFCKFYAGMKRPAHFTPEQYKQIVERDLEVKAWALKILTKYDLDYPVKEEEKKQDCSKKNEVKKDEVKSGTTTLDIIDKLGGIDGVNKAMKMNYKNMDEVVKGIEEQLHKGGFAQLKNGVWVKMVIGETKVN